MAKLKKSKFYDDFKVTSPSPEQKQKHIWLKVWKWLRIIIIVFFASIGLVGCVQSFTSKTASKVGAGYEFYSSKKTVSPNVELLRYNKETNTFTMPNSEKHIVKNIFLGLNNGNKELINALEQQDAKANGGKSEYGIYGGNSLALQYEKLNDDNKTYSTITDADAKFGGDVYGNKENKFSYLNLTSKDYKYETITEHSAWTTFSFTNHIEEVAKNQKRARFDKISKIEVETLEESLLPGASNIDKFTRDSLQLLALQTLKIWYERNVNNIRWLINPANVENKDLNQQFTASDANEIFGTTPLPANPTPLDIYKRLVAMYEKISQTKASDKIENSDYIFKNDPFYTTKTDWKDKDGKPLVVKDKNGVVISNPTFNQLSKAQQHDQLSRWYKYQWIKDAINFATFHKIAFRSYYSLFNYTGQAYKNVTYGSNVVTNSIVKVNHITKGGNYNERLPIANIFPSAFNVPQKALYNAKGYWEQGPFYGMFIHPIYLFMNKIMVGLGSTGWSVILALVITVVFVRLIAFFISLKSTFGQSKLEEINRKKAKIEAKYAEYKGDKAMQQKKQMEISQLYKESKISPFSSMVSLLITMPILFVVYRIISSAPEIKQASWYGIQLSTSSISRVMAKDFIYLPLIIFSVAVQALATYMPKILNWKKKKSERVDAYEKEAMKKSNRTNNIVQLIFIFIGVIFSAGLQIYWIISGIWTIFQTVFVHYFTKTRFFKEKVEPKLFREKTA